MEGTKNKISGDGPTEIEQPIIIAGRAAYEHVLQHLLDGGLVSGCSQ